LHRKEGLATGRAREGGVGLRFWGEIATRHKTAGLFAGWTCRKLRVSP
jgi:hypothetical protein